jgi:nucleotide-binding universal stress UspA family protein
MASARRTDQRSPAVIEKVMLGIKPGTDGGPLLPLMREMVPAPRVLHLVSLVRIGTDNDEPDRLAATEQSLEALAERLRSEGYTVETTVSFNAVSAGGQLAELADDHGADLLIIGMAKRSRVGKALVGSDAQSVLIAAPCPVICVRTS